MKKQMLSDQEQQQRRKEKKVEKKKIKRQQDIEQLKKESRETNYIKFLRDQVAGIKEELR